MKTPTLICSALLATTLCVAPVALPAQIFDSGSDGSDGAYSPTSSEVFSITKAEYNFTSINIPDGVTITFDPALDANYPVVWLAQDNVTIDGVVDVSGGAGHTSRATMRLPGAAGPGGWPGGVGATGSMNGSDTTLFATAGMGPGGAMSGISDTRSGGGAGHRTDGSVGTGSSDIGNEYGNAFGIPLLGGSGGAGATRGAFADRTGAGGGGGSGAILIATSADMFVSGSVLANGGAGGATDDGGDYGGGAGSGGTIRLVANHLDVSGSLAANGGPGGTGPGSGVGGSGSAGYVRLEAFSFSLTGTSSPQSSTGVPVTAQLDVTPRLSIASVGGMAVSSPSGVVTNPDVSLSTSDPVTVVLNGSNIPLGTVVNVRAFPVTGSAVEVDSPGLSGTIESSTTSVDFTLPAGVTQITATASFTPLSRSAGEETVEVSASLP